MPKHCSIPGCTSRSDKEGCKTVSFHTIPRDVSIRHQWLVSIKKPITISEHTRICSLHFVGGMKSASSPIPTLFPWSTPAAVRATPRQRSPPTPQPKHPKLEEQLYEALDEAQTEIDARDKRIEELESEVVSMRMEVFGLQFARSDSDILFYTDLPTYCILMSLFKYIEPLLSRLNYCPESSSVYFRGCHRALQPVDEFFMVLVQLRLALLEKDLAHNILTTWVIFLNQQL